MSKHTPGPWHLTPRSQTRAEGWKIETKNMTVAVVLWSSAIDEANARLIAAAPELKAAAIWAHEELTKAGYECDTGACVICVAICKTEGCAHAK